MTRERARARVSLSNTHSHTPDKHIYTEKGILKDRERHKEERETRREGER